MRFNKEGCFIEDGEGNLQASGSRSGRLFKLDSTLPPQQSAMYGQSGPAQTDMELWHKRVGHMNFQRLKGLPDSGLVTGLPKFRSSEPTHICEACQFGKQARQPFRGPG